MKMSVIVIFIKILNKVSINLSYIFAQFLKLVFHMTTLITLLQYGFAYNTLIGSKLFCRLA